MIFFLIVVFGLVPIAIGFPEVPNDANKQSLTNAPIPIVAQTEITGADGSFNYSYETGNGIRMEESSYLKRSPSSQSRTEETNGVANGNGNDEGIQVKVGSYSYTAPDGTVISLRYVADENGFQPEGDHLPASPQNLQKLTSQIPLTLVRRDTYYKSRRNRKRYNDYDDDSYESGAIVVA